MTGCGAIKTGGAIVVVSCAGVSTAASVSAITSEVGATCLATPAISGGALFIRTDDLAKPANNFLLCIGKK